MHLSSEEGERKVFIGMSGYFLFYFTPCKMNISELSVRKLERAWSWWTHGKRAFEE